MSSSYCTKAKSAYISSIICGINSLTIDKIKSIGKNFDASFLLSLGVSEAILTTKNDLSTIPVLCIKMSTGSYHCINYTTYPAEPRFFNASFDDKIQCSLGIIGSIESDTVIICEGIWDYFTLKFHGIKCIALPGVNNLPRASLIDLEGKRIYLCFDNDKPGQTYSIKHAKTICSVAESVHIIKIPISISGENVKDISDVHKVVKNSFKEYFDNLIENANYFEYNPIREIQSIMSGEGSSQAKVQMVQRTIINDIEAVRMGEIIPYDKYHDIAIIDGGRRILSDEKVDQYLSRIYDFCGSDQNWQLIRDKLYNYATRKVNVIIDIYSTYKDNKIYLGLENNGVLVLDGNSELLNSQGINSVYIRSGHGILNGTIDYKNVWSFEKLIDLFNFESEENKFLLKAWFYFTFFIPRMKPILAIYADKGCGKTLLQKIMKGILFGFDKCDPNVLPEEDISFIMMVKENKYLFFDEVDRYNNSMKPYLRTLSTGVEIVYRPKYSKDNVRFIPNVWLSLSANSPKFRDDDVAQRLVIVNLLKFTGATIREDLFLDSLQEHRKEIFSKIVEKLKVILKNLQNEEEIKLDNYCRLVEFSNFAYNAFPEERDICLRAFNSINREQQKFSSELDPVIDLMENWIASHHNMIQSGHIFTSKEIYDSLVNDGRHREIKFFPASAASFGKWLGSRIEELSERFGMERMASRTHSYKYQFDKEKCKSYQEEF